MTVPHGGAAAAAITLSDLHMANIARQAEWCAGGDPEPDLSFRGNELAGETGEACNVIKKLERERHGWRGSRASLTDLAEELADVVICADLCAVSAGIDLGAAVVAKFNATSAKVGLTTMLATPSAAPAVPGELRALSDAATPGRMDLQEIEPGDFGVPMIAVPDDVPVGRTPTNGIVAAAVLLPSEVPIDEFAGDFRRSQANAAFIRALWNGYRSGHLVVRALATATPQAEDSGLRDVLIAVRDRIISPIYGGIDDTFWMSNGETVVDFINAALSRPQAKAQPAAEPVGDDPIVWAVSRWKAEVENRPHCNVHRRSLDTTWRQVISHFGGDPDALIGPSHDELTNNGVQS